MSLFRSRWIGHSHDAPPSRPRPPDRVAYSQLPDRFGAEVEMDDADLDGIDQAPPLEARASSMADSLRALSKAASEETLDRLGELSPVVESDLRAVLKTAPAELVRLVQGAILSAAEALAEDPSLSAEEKAKLDPLERGVLNVGHDPRNLQEAAEALGKMATIASTSKTTARLAGQTLELLERKGVLGEGTLAAISAFVLAAASTTIAWQQGQSMVLKAGHVSLSVNRLGEYSASLSVTNPAWPAMATKVIVTRNVRGAPRKGDVFDPLEDVNLSAPAVSSVTVQPVVLKTTVGQRKARPVELGTSVTVTPTSGGGRPEVEGGASVKVRFGGDSRS